MSLYMESTSISVEQTVAEIQRVLSRYKCKAIQTTFDDAGEVAAVMFLIDVGGSEVPFKLPARWEPVYQQLNTRRKPRFQAKHEQGDREQAKRVAWRQILRWVEAQLALVQTNMVKMEEVFLAYAHFRDGRTLFERIVESGFPALEDKRTDQSEHRARDGAATGRQR